MCIVCQRIQGSLTRPAYKIGPHGTRCVGRGQLAAAHGLEGLPRQRRSSLQETQKSRRSFPGLPFGEMTMFYFKTSWFGRGTISTGLFLFLFSGGLQQMRGFGGTKAAHFLASGHRR